MTLRREREGGVVVGQCPTPRRKPAAGIPKYEVQTETEPRMTTPYLRTKALVQAKELLQALTDPTASPGVPDNVRAHANAVLKHYPKLAELQVVHEALPDLIGPVPPFARLRGSAETEAVLAVAALGASGQSLREKP